MAEPSVQERYAPESICFGCGPANPQGLRIRSFQQGDAVVARFRPQKHHEAFPGMVNGGIIGALLDCHCNWAAALHLMHVQGESAPPCTVTAEYAIKLLRPTPSDTELELSASVEQATQRRAVITGTLVANGEVCAECRGTFVAVKPGHPAYHRWG